MPDGGRSKVDTAGRSTRPRHDGAQTAWVLEVDVRKYFDRFRTHTCAKSFTSESRMVSSGGTAPSSKKKPAPGRTSAGGDQRQRASTGFTKSDMTATESSCAATVPQYGSTAAMPLIGPCDCQPSRLLPS
jgi:hypothetical protein